MIPIYLDHNATTPIDPEVARAIALCLAEAHANPASQHQAGRRARAALEQAREGAARLLGARLDGHRADRLIFTSGGTEANNLALFGLAGRAAGRGIISSIEHPSIARAAEELARRGWCIERVRVTRDGVLDLDHLERLLAETAQFASIIWGNNETGVLQPIERIAELCRRVGVPLHVDAVQVVGKLPVDFAALGVATLSLAAHKFHGPRGVGALLVGNEVELYPQMFGGVQQGAIRPGTEDVALAAGLCRALERCNAAGDERARQMAILRDRLETGLRAVWPALVVHGATVPRLPNTICASFVGLDRQALLLALDMAGVACSAGSACASGAAQPSPTLAAMGLPQPIIGSAVRFSVGATTTAEEIGEAVGRISLIINNLQMASQTRKLAAPARGGTPDLVE